MRRSLAALSLASSIALLGACDSHAGRLLVVVDSNLTVPGELVMVRAIVRRPPGGEPTATQDFVLRDPSGPPLGLMYDLPISFVVEPSDPNGGQVAVEVEAHGTRDGSGTPLVVRRAVTGFSPGKTLLLPMFLARSCIGVTCEEGYTCTENGCEPEAVSLRVATEPGSEIFSFPDAAPISDAAMMIRNDASTDAGVDATDASTGCVPGTVATPFAIGFGSARTFALVPAPGEWIHNAAAGGGSVTAIASWGAIDAPPGCTFTSADISLPLGVPAETDRATGCRLRPARCAEHRTRGATYSFAAGAGVLPTLFDAHVNQEAEQAAGRTSFSVPLPSGSTRVAITLGNVTDDTSEGEAYIVLHDVVFHYE